MFTLFRWQLRQVSGLNLLTIIVATCWAIFDSSVLEPLQTPTIVLMVLGHCLGMLWILGRNSPRRSGFLYCQGFSRDQIWWSTWLATLAASVCVGLAIWLAIVLRLRSTVQEWFGNPWFPLVGADEAGCAVTVVLMYVAVLSVGHFVWVRSRLPEPDPGAGWSIALLLAIFGGFTIDNVSPYRTSVMLSAGWLLVVLTLTVVAWKIHQNSEVQA